MKDPRGRVVHVSYRVEDVVGDVVTLVEQTCAADGTPLRVDRASLRFLDVPTLNRFLSDVGFTVGACPSRRTPVMTR